MYILEIKPFKEKSDSIGHIKSRAKEITKRLMLSM